MSMKSFAAAVFVALALTPRPASAQTATTELDVTGGHSTESVDAAASQVRVFGDAVAGWQYYVEAAWGQQWGPRSDAFGAAFGYDKRLRPTEVYLERTILKGPYLAGVRVGQFRTPFGMYTRSDQAYNGFTRAPLIRYGSYWGLSNNFLEDGVSVIAGTPRLFAEASAGRPNDMDSYARKPGLDSTLRVQGAIGPFVAGVSHIHTQPPVMYRRALGASVFTGMDVRWMSHGVQVRGEWITGHSIGGTHTAGGYVDAMVHRPVMGPLTAVFRAERLDYPAGAFSSYPRRYTAGGRVRISSQVTAQVNVVHQPTDVRLKRISAVDFGLTFSARR
jgi:hypothetical protein